jgi:predicted GH43/DUF377 family glycosyl hydrolase
MATSGRRIVADGRHAGRRRSSPRLLRVSLAAVLVALLVGGAVAAINHFGTTASSASADSAASQAALPSWAIGPFERYSHNPVLTSPAVPTTATEWEWPELFNPGVVVVNGVFHMLYRGADFGDVSSIGAATSTDGYHFSPMSASPVIPHTLPSENQGVEDPRLYYLDGTYYAFFTGDSGATVGANEPDELCVAVTDYRTMVSGGVNAGIVVFVAGQLTGHGRWYYAISEIDVSRSRLLTAAAELKNPVLYPQAPYELFGHTPKTVFMNSLIFHHGQWWMYYGAGDSVVALALAPLRPSQ